MLTAAWARRSTRVARRARRAASPCGQRTCWQSPSPIAPGASRPSFATMRRYENSHPDTSSPLCYHVFHYYLCLTAAEPLLCGGQSVRSLAQHTLPGCPRVENDRPHPRCSFTCTILHNYDLARWLFRFLRQATSGWTAACEATPMWTPRCDPMPGVSDGSAPCTKSSTPC